MAEVEHLDESILNIDDTEAQQSIEFDESQIAELLGEEEANKNGKSEKSSEESNEKAQDVPMIDETAEAAGSSKKADKEEEEGEKKKSEEPEIIETPQPERTVQVGDEVVQLAFDEEVVEEVILADSPEIVEEKENGTRSRKRSVILTSPPKSPARKRQRRRISTYFAVRKAVIDKITAVLSSYDRAVNLDSLQTIIHMVLDTGRKNKQVYDENIEKVKKENAMLRRVLEDEKLAHAFTLKKLTSMEKEVLEITENIRKLSDQLTIPPAPELDTNEYTKWGQKEPTPQPPPHRRHLPPPQYYAPSVGVVSRRPGRGGQIVQQRTVRLYQTQQRIPPPPPPPPQIRLPQQLHQMPTLIHEPARIVPIAPRRSNPGWPSIPIPTNTNLGHNHDTSPSNGSLKDLIDSTDSSGRIVLGIPYVAPSNVMPMGDVAFNKQPTLPKVFETLEPNPDLTVTITSSAKDFGENWQIGGKIVYEHLPALENKVVQLFVQVGSLRACGMGGRVGTMRRMCDWGISKEWECTKKAHKFRIMFHRSQLLPQMDRVSVLAVVRDVRGGTILISSPSSLNLC